jgi:hypothetical protein
MMHVMRAAPGLVAAACASMISTVALADNPLGLYVGVGAGVANIGSTHYGLPYGFDGGFHDHDASWKVMLGVRPLSFIGAEAEYLDFGTGHGNSGFYGLNSYYDSGAFSHPKATIVYGVGYLPIPLPFLDVFGKLGVANLQTNIDYQVCTSVVSAPGGGLSCANSTSARLDRHDTNLAYGAGVQARFQDFVFRAEYERVSSSYGYPSTFMVSASWVF